MLKNSMLILTLAMSQPVFAASLEVLHWWTAEGEVQSQLILKKALAEKDIKWQSFAITGEGGDSALRVLQMRSLSGTPPDAAQIKGPDIGEWAKVGMLENIDTLINTSNWPNIMPKVVRNTVTFDGNYMAVPINVHRVNWLWLNKKIFKELKLAIPQTWDEFFTVADKIKAAGYLPLALGGTAWQDALIFESMALSILGPEKYIKAFVDFDESVLNSPEMVVVFEKFKGLSAYTDKSIVDKDWYYASQLIATDQAAMQFMGDWAKGMWQAKGKTAMVDYLCVDVPESKGLYSYNIDSFVMFDKYAILPKNNVQILFSEILLSKKFQLEFNLSKGSIPIRNDIDMSNFDQCSQKSYADFKSSTLVPSFTQNLATTSQVQHIMIQIISNYFNDPDAQAEETVRLLSLAIHAMH
ncbi:ABC transporter substrate-binding protein [Psychromonas sp. MME2]|uniref:ABC transporter substrate-binding protein n=2 Tax=unclassified Psychromonas TaxID=2614957 RepID=UPI00339BF9D4